MKAEIITSFERDKKYYVLLEVEQEQHAMVKNGFFEIIITTPISMRCPEIASFNFKAWVKKDYVTFNIDYGKKEYQLKFPVNICNDYDNLDLFDLSEEVPITVYLKDMLVCAKNGTIDYKLQLWARCGNAVLKIGDVKDSIKY